MRTLTCLAAAAALVAATTARAEPPAAPPASALAPMLSFYPPQARAAGIEGSATLQCAPRRTPGSHPLRRHVRDAIWPRLRRRRPRHGGPVAAQPVGRCQAGRHRLAGPDYRSEAQPQPAVVRWPRSAGDDAPSSPTPPTCRCHLPRKCPPCYPKAALGADVSGHVTLDCEVTGRRACWLRAPSPARRRPVWALATPRGRS